MNKTIQLGALVKGLQPDELCRIDEVTDIAGAISLRFVGIQSNKVFTRILMHPELDKLEIIGKDGEFSFQGDAEKKFADKFFLNHEIIIRDTVTMSQL
jgi:hypothetical protein